MAAPLSQAESDYWQKKFIDYGWHGRSLEHRLALSKILDRQIFDFNQGALFCAYAGNDSPTQVREIRLGRDILAGLHRSGLFAAIHDRFIIAEIGLLQLPFSDCQKYRVSWLGERILVEIDFRNHGVLSVIVNTWVPRNFIDKLMGDNVNPYVIQKYGEMASGINSFLERIVSK